MTPFDIIKIINNKLSYDRDEVLANYNPWIINRAFSNTIDTIFYASELNLLHHMDNGMQFDFYYNLVPKNPKRFGKWNKEDTSQDFLINSLCKWLSINRTQSKSYLKFLSDKDKQYIIEIEGGR